MKQYDRETKRWVESDVLDKRLSSRDPKVCRGKKPHDFVLVLPLHVHPAEGYKGDPKAYYDLMDERYQLLEDFNKKVAEIGVRGSYHLWNRKESRLYICSVCSKRKYEDIN